MLKANHSIPWVIGLGIMLGAGVDGPAVGQSGALTPIARGGWTLRYVDSQDLVGGNYAATNAFDGDPASIWATEWYTASPLPPHELQIDLGAVYSVGGFQYLPRQDGVPYGGIGQYQFFVSMDGVTWGPPVASGTFASTSAEQQVLFTPTSARYISLYALTEIDGQPWTTVAELNVLEALGSPAPSLPPPSPPPPSPPNEGTIARGAWTLHFVDSQDLVGGNYAAINVFDGDPSSIWATEWYAASPPPPHELQIDLGAVYSVGGFQYLPRQDGIPYGGIAQYQFFVSLDGVTWGAAVAAGTFASTSAEQQVLFPPKTGRYIRLQALSEVNGQPWTVVAELNVLAAAGSPPPSIPPSSIPPPTGSQFPEVSLIDEGGGGPYLAPATISLRATASDPDGVITRVDFFSGSTLVGADTTAPYTLVLSPLGPAVYSFRAAALDNSGNTTSSYPVTVVVGQTKQAMFEPSTDHDTLVERYVLEIFPAEADLSAAGPLATLDLGKPPIVNGECQVDISVITAGLAPGAYVGTVSAVGIGGTTRSAPSPPFVP